MKKQQATPEFLADQDNTLPGELPSFNATETSRDASKFVQFEVPGDTFDGVFICNVQKGTNDVKFDCSVYAEYPSGEIKLLPLGWSQHEEQTKQHDKGRNMIECVQRMTLERIKVSDEGTKKEKTVKLFTYGYMNLNPLQLAEFRKHINKDEVNEWIG
jgi:hypothetical protein